MQSCAMVPELKSRAALERGDFSLKAAAIGVPSCNGQGVCSCVLPAGHAKMHGHVAALAQVILLPYWPFSPAGSGSPPVLACPSLLLARFGVSRRLAPCSRWCHCASWLLTCFLARIACAVLPAPRRIDAAGGEYSFRRSRFGLRRVEAATRQAQASASRSRRAPLQRARAQGTRRGVRGSGGPGVRVSRCPVGIEGCQPAQRLQLSAGMPRHVPPSHCHVFISVAAQCLGQLGQALGKVYSRRGPCVQASTLRSCRAWARVEPGEESLLRYYPKLIRGAGHSDVICSPLRN